MPGVLECLVLEFTKHSSAVLTRRSPALSGRDKLEPGGPGGAIMAFAKGEKPRTQSDRPRGGPVLTTRSRFMKTPDVFREDVERQEYGPKKRPGGELSQTEGESKLKSAKEKSGKPVMKAAEIAEEGAETAKEEREEEC